MKSLTNEQQKSYQKAKKCYNCSEKFEDEHAKDNSQGQLSLYKET